MGILSLLTGKDLIFFENKVVKYLEELSITEKAQGLECDHLGLRFKEIEKIESLKKELEKESKLLSSVKVNGREISIYELNIPLKFSGWSVGCVELPYPKTVHEYDDGWEHVEFVIPSKATDLDSFRDDFQSFFLELNINSLKLDGSYSEDTPHAESDQLPNPSIALKKNKHLTIKFHPNSIKSVVTNSL